MQTFCPVADRTDQLVALGRPMRSSMPQSASVNSFLNCYPRLAKLREAGGQTG